MNNSTRIFSSFLVSTLLFASCSSSTMIQSNPSKAKLYLDGAYVGETPYLQRDTKIVGSSMVVKLEKEGYKPLISTITKDEEVDVGAVIGGVFFAVPFLWTMKYLPVHNYELKKIEEDKIIEPQKNQITQKSRADKLRELKQLLDDKIITQNEFEKEKAKILNTIE
ncbi:MAG: PEGA domain-containing protein [Bacteroidales bacterium]|nr:PEGA domain-containing protein [Bacteroidales bacterium]MDD2612049.1 PEGA domain-containing protein [Bacteroidales bacterium]MDD4712854.1 PEGA domain-containing protein [Bacteroidales bacterium]MEA4839442.1 PEGA domain-containing protein [Bacteroidales bacterium]